MKSPSEVELKVNLIQSSDYQKQKDLKSEFQIYAKFAPHFMAQFKHAVIMVNGDLTSKTFRMGWFHFHDWSESELFWFN